MILHGEIDHSPLEGHSSERGGTQPEDPFSRGGGAEGRQGKGWTAQPGLQTEGPAAAWHQHQELYDMLFLVPKFFKPSNLLMMFPVWKCT